MKLTVQERSANSVIRALIDACIAMSGGSYVVDELITEVCRRTKRVRKTLYNAMAREWVGALLENIRKQNSHADSRQMELFPDFAFVPQLIVIRVKNEPVRHLFIREATLAEYDFWMAQEIKKNMARVEGKHAHYAEYRSQLQQWADRYGTEYTIGKLMDLAVAETPRQSAVG